MTQIPKWLLDMLPMWDYVCPRCRHKKSSAKLILCPECGIPLCDQDRFPPLMLKSSKHLIPYLITDVYPKLEDEKQKWYVIDFITALNIQIKKAQKQ